MNKEQIVNQTADYIKTKLTGEGSGHDWWHVYRVWKNAVHISKHENVDLFVVELAALLHDIADWKFHDGNDDVGPQLAREWLKKLEVDEIVISHVCQIIKDASFKGSRVVTKMKSTEGMVVQDADRLDAIGAIGIARAFASGAKFNESFYDSVIAVPEYKDETEYIKAKGKVGRTTINHFYEKLLLLKELMNTAAAKKIAKKRHKIMKEYLENFFQEWEGKD